MQVQVIDHLIISKNGFFSFADAGDFDIKDQTSSLDFGLLFGAGYDLGTGRIDARYGLGMGNVIDDESAGDLSVKNAVITIGATYMF